MTVFYASVTEQQEMQREVTFDIGLLLSCGK